MLPWDDPKHDVLGDFAPDRHLPPTQRMCEEGLTQLGYGVTHHLVPQPVRGRRDGAMEMACIWCDKTEKEIRDGR